MANAGQLSRRSALLGFGAALAGAGSLSVAGAQMAQPRAASLVGLWSMQLTDTRGGVTGTVFTNFGAQGAFMQRWVIPRGTVDYQGEYRLSADGNSLQSVYRDHSPKTDCRLGACYPVVPAVRMNTPMTTQLRWVSANLFMTEDGGGSNRWIRQQ